MINKNIKLLFVIFLILTQNLQANEIRTNDISRDTYRFKSILDTRDIVIEYFDRQLPNDNTSKWLTWYENDFFDTSRATNFILQALYCSNPYVFNIVHKDNKRLLIINRSLDGGLEMILIDDCDHKKEVNKLK